MKGTKGWVYWLQFSPQQLTIHGKRIILFCFFGISRFSYHENEEIWIILTHVIHSMIYNLQTLGKNKNGNTKNRMTSCMSSPYIFPFGAYCMTFWLSCFDWWILSMQRNVYIEICSSESKSCEWRCSEGRIFWFCRTLL